MTLLFALLSVLCGWGGLCAAMPRHQRQLLQRELSPMRSRRLRSVGWFYLIVALLLAMRVSGVVVGLIQWTAMLGAGGSAFAYALPYAADALHARRRKKPERFGSGA